MSRASGWLMAVLALSGCKTSSESTGAAPAPSGPERTEKDWRSPRSERLEVGDEAPDFESIAHTGQSVRLSEFADKPVVVYFFPTNASQEAATRAESIRDRWMDLRARLEMVLGVSPDSNVAQRDFATDRELPFLLVADTDRSIARAFGVRLHEDQPEPVTFVIDKELEVLQVLDDDVEPAQLGTRLNEALSALDG